MHSLQESHSDIFNFEPNFDFYSIFDFDEITQFYPFFLILSYYRYYVPGVSYRNSQNTSDDDTFSVDFTLQMADSKVATDQSLHNVSFGLEVSGGNIIVLSLLVTASRTSAETVIFNISSTVDSVNSTTWVSRLKSLCNHLNMYFRVYGYWCSGLLHTRYLFRDFRVLLLLFVLGSSP